MEEIHAISALTHTYERSLVACGIYKFVTDELLHKPNKSSITKGLQIQVYSIITVQNINHFQDCFLMILL